MEVRFLECQQEFPEVPTEDEVLQKALLIGILKEVPFQGPISLHLTMEKGSSYLPQG